MSEHTLPIELRAATAADAAVITALEQQIFVSDAWSAGQIAEELAAPYRSYFVAQQGGEVCGYAGVLVIGAEADVQTIAVAESRRGRGIGASLLRALNDAAVAQGATDMFLEVRVDNPAAIALYQKFGFARLGVRPKYYQPEGVDALIMRALLPLAQGAAEGEENATA